MARANPRLFFFVESYFQERDYRRYGIEALQARGISVEVWEIFRPYRRHYARNYSPPDPSSFSGVRRFRTGREIGAAIDTLTPNDAVIAPWGWAMVWRPSAIFRALARRNVHFGSMVMATVHPAVSRFQWPTPGRLLDAMYRRLPQKLRRTQPWRYLLLCGGEALRFYTEDAPGADQVWTHALDYDLALEARKNGEAPRNDHIVFLDEYVPFHPDYLVHGSKPPNSAEEYYPKLCRVFAMAEKALDRRVVIAAHPRSNYSADADYFEGRQVIRGQTCELVRRAALVFTHCSLSNNFTAIYRKPSLGLTTNGLRDSFYGPFIEATARTLGRPLINLDAIPARLEIPPPDPSKYDGFCRSIIKLEGTPEENTWEILARYLHTRA